MLCQAGLMVGPALYQNVPWGLRQFLTILFSLFSTPIEGAMKNAKKSYTICIILTEQREGCKIYPEIWIVHIEQSGRKKEQFRVY